MSVFAELEEIRARNAGVLLPSEVVEFAKNPNTELHTRFTWDDSKAAQEYRLWQAREVIRVAVTVLPQQSQPVKAYVSLIGDRKDGGYRFAADVMSEPVLRASLLRQALAELNQCKAKYKTIKELAKVFEALEEVQNAV